MTALQTLIQALREAKSKSTPVVSWYVHTHDRTIRGPFCRWFQILEPETEEIQRGKVCRASFEHDLEYFASAANELPKLLKVLEVQQKALAFFMDTYPDSTQTYVISSEAIAECEVLCGK
jgi:hypothetical protein